MHGLDVVSLLFQFDIPVIGWILSDLRCPCRYGWPACDLDNNQHPTLGCGTRHICSDIPNSLLTFGKMWCR